MSQWHYPQEVSVPMWAYRSAEAPGVIIIPPPPSQNHPFYAYAQPMAPNGVYGKEEENQRLHNRRSHRISNGLRRVSAAVSKSIRVPDGSKSGHGDYVDAQPDSVEQSLLGRWPSVSQHMDVSADADHGHGTRDADDSFFLHGADPNAGGQHILLPPRVRSPVLVELKPSADYAKMDSPSSSTPDISLNSYITRLFRFIKDVNHLPWKSYRPTVDYYPGAPVHKRFHSDPFSEEDWNAMSWYAHLHRQYIDLLSSESDGSTSPPLNSALADQPNLSYEHQASDYYHPDSTFSQDFGHVYYPNGYAPESASVELQHGDHEWPNSTPIYGPRLPSHISGNQYPYPLPWPPPLFIPRNG